MTPADLYMEELSSKVAEKVLAQMRRAPVITPRLLDVDQTAIYLGRTAAAIRSMLAAGTLKNASPDGRVQFDIKDLDILIINSKR